MDSELNETPLLDERYYLSEVYPRLRSPLSHAYPLVRLGKAPGFHGLGTHPLLMLVALTGTGKTTTLQCLKRILGASGMGLIPSRRELADWVALPMMQRLNNAEMLPVNDRVQRFSYTRSFAKRVPGGLAAVFSWLYLSDNFNKLIFSEGIRGEKEIRYALTRFPAWQIVELSLNPLTRLQRLSDRRDHFDRASGDANLSFLPRELRAKTRALLNAGNISDQAIKIMVAEAENYGLSPFADGNQFPNYHRITMEGRNPNEVAQLVANIVETCTNAEN